MVKLIGISTCHEILLRNKTTDICSNLVESLRYYDKEKSQPLEVTYCMIPLV